ncbi:MAG: NAD(P)-dependent alcohol dehydrogenase [Pseudomonadota bacterium]|nr:NAD(P)-dependent alcohol dehydrogenase [Pseudomonadota bacterium]
MRALRFAQYGAPEVLHVVDVPEPEPGAGEAKVRVHAAGLNPLDWKIRAGHLRMLPFVAAPPRGLGSDFAGEIVAVGGGATARHVGERVLGSLLPFSRRGALAEFVTASYDRLLPLPDDVDSISAAALPVAGGTALQALVDHAHLLAGQRVLITGAAGGVGHFAVQIAKHLGAHVTAVCSTHNVEFVRGLGADAVIDYTRDDFTRATAPWDVIFDAASVATFGTVSPVLARSGVYLNTAGSGSALAATLASGLIARLTSQRRSIAIVLRSAPAMWQRLLELFQAGTLRPTIESIHGLANVAAAQRAMETGHGRGKKVVTIFDGV